MINGKNILRIKFDNLLSDSFMLLVGIRLFKSNDRI